MGKTLEELKRELSNLKSRREIERIGQRKTSEKARLQNEIRALKYGGIMGVGKNLKSGFTNLQKSGIGKTFKRISINAAKSQRRKQRTSNPFGMPKFGNFG